MTLYDQIIDEAENLASNRILYNPTNSEIIEAVSEIVDVKLGHKSIGGQLAIEAFRRYDIERLLVA